MTAKTYRAAALVVLFLIFLHVLPLFGWPAAMIVIFLFGLASIAIAKA
jgi:hypothetical protein